MDFDKAYLIVSGLGFLRNCLCLKIEPQLDMSGNLGFPGCEAEGINFNWLKVKTEEFRVPCTPPLSHSTICFPIMDTNLDDISRLCRSLLFMHWARELQMDQPEEILVLALQD